MEALKWEDVYELWRSGYYDFPHLLNEPVEAEKIFVEYLEEGSCFYGYDWIESAEVPQWKKMICQRPTELLYFSKPSNKGTIQTAEMLIEARDEEEHAAIWIAATAKELHDAATKNPVRCHADALYMAACQFLRSRFYLWHHAMRRLVPKVMIPWSVLENLSCQDVTPVMGLIQMNTALLRNTWSILKYSSLKDDTNVETHCRLPNA